MNKEYIIRSNKEFNHIINHGLIMKSIYFKIYSRPNTKNNIRFGISVPKKLGNAVIRNKNRRQIKEILRLNLSLYNNSPNDYIIIINKPFINLTFNDKINVVNKFIKEELQK